MRILSLDLAQRTGYACGVPGAPPSESGALILKKQTDPQQIAFGQLQDWLFRRFSGPKKPDLVVRERSFNLEAYKNKRNSQSNVEMAYGMRAIVMGMCHQFCIREEQAHVATVRKHILGVGYPKVEDRDELKLLVIRRCKLIGLLPKDAADDDDRADAVAIFDWACMTFGRRSHSMTTLALFGEERRK